jgi:Protein of unknown function (DUF1573)
LCGCNFRISKSVINPVFYLIKIHARNTTSMITGLPRIIALLAAILIAIPTPQAQTGTNPNISELLEKLTPAEHAQLIELILTNQELKNEGVVKKLYNSLSPESELLVNDYIRLLRDKDYLAPSNVDFSTDTIDFGRVRIGSILRDTLHFEVLEPAPYVIKSVISSCGHLNADIPEFPSMPGQTGDIPITLNTRKLTEGPIRLLISIRGNNGPYHRKFVYVKAELFASIDYSLQRP